MVVASDADGSCWESLAVHKRQIEIVIGVDVPLAPVIVIGRIWV